MDNLVGKNERYLGNLCRGISTNIYHFTLHLTHKNNVQIFYLKILYCINILFISDIFRLTIRECL